MISKSEREHLVTLEKWSAASRAGLQELQKGPYSKIVEMLIKDKKPEVFFDNIDWLLTLIKREYHRQGVRALMTAVEKYEASEQS